MSSPSCSNLMALRGEKKTYLKHLSAPVTDSEALTRISLVGAGIEKRSLSSPFDGSQTFMLRLSRSRRLTMSCTTPWIFTYPCITRVSVDPSTICILRLRGNPDCARGHPVDHKDEKEIKWREHADTLALGRRAAAEAADECHVASRNSSQVRQLRRCGLLNSDLVQVDP